MIIKMPSPYSPQSSKLLLPLCPTQRIIGALTLYRNGAHELAKQWAPVKHISLLTDAEKNSLLRSCIRENE